MKDKSIEEKMEYIATKQGFLSCANQCIEEMAELTQAICKFKRSGGEGLPTSVSMEDAYEHLIEELTDVEITLSHLERWVGSREKMQRIKEYKVDRTIDRMNGVWKQ